MLRLGMLYRHCTAAAAILILAGAAAAVAQPPATPPAETFLTVFMQGMPLGTETVTITSNADGWLIKGSGRLGAPVNVTTSRFEAYYDRDWKPLRLEIDGSVRGQPLILRTTFANGTATSEIMQAGQQSQKSDAVAADTIVLPNMFFAAYEALAIRLAGTKAGDELRAYIAPQVEIPVQVTGVTEERIRMPASTIVARRYDVTFVNPNGNVAGEVWIDADSRLLRFRVNSQGLEVARSDVASVSARIERGTRPGDEQVRMPASGFSLAGTLSRPGPTVPDPKAKNIPRLPAVVLVPGSGAVDRDETAYGISVFTQLASALADAGFIVVRYDKRGIGQSGGRQEAATIDDFAEDVRAVVNYLRKRKDVDEKRIAIVGHSEGGFTGMLAASRDKKRVAALVLVATPGTTGGELVLEQQRHILDRLPLPEGERRNRMELQQKIQQSVISGAGWEAIPSGFKRQADTPWFRSFLLFDPAKVLPRVEEPLLIVQAERDRQVPLRHGELLLALGKGRKANWGTDLVVVDGINHLLVPAPTGEVTEYATLTDKTVSPALTGHITRWLTEKIAAPAAGKQ
ncbi:MAG: alpha/beta fold hydrolase [Vicinamibacterales bacterium]|nr:alpha/beta fold hydrolase [Vicinamibacterales bacterium]